MKDMALGIVLVLALVLGMAGPAMAKYEVIEVSNGGSIKGKVTVTGNVPKDETLTIDADQEICGTSRPANKYVISGKGEVQNAFVIVDDIKKGKAPPKQNIMVENIKCAFVPHVGLAYKKAKFEIKNGDPIFHNTKMLLESGRPIYNIALPKQNQVIKKSVRKLGIVKLNCAPHKWMRGYLYASAHPYVAITGADGSFEIKDLPPGKYTLKIWHEGLGVQKQTVEVTAGGVAETSIEYKK